MPFTEARITLEADIWTSPDRAKCQYALELTVYGYESDQEPSRFSLPTFDYGPIVVRLCDKWLKTVRETLFARDLISEDQAGLLIDLFLSYRAIAARAPGVDDDTFPELLHQLIEGALSSTRGDTADDVLAAAVLHMHDLLPAATFHDPTDLSALTAGERASRGGGARADTAHSDPTSRDATRADPALPDPTLTSASLTARARARARVVPRPIVTGPTTAVASNGDLSSTSARCGSAAAGGDADDDMPPLVSPTSPESDIGDFGWL